jgi:glycine oxidase
MPPISRNCVHAPPRSFRSLPELESWAGLRPDTPDHLPLIGRTGHNRFIAAGHFRNGILLAPGTARVMLQLVQGQQPEVDLTAFSPDRFHRQP